LLDLCGYKILSIQPNIYYFKMRSAFEYLKTGYWGEAFMIVAEKPVHR